MSERSKIAENHHRRWPLGVSSDTNFRDLGGLRTDSGMRTLWNRLYRGAAPCLTQREQLGRLGVRVVIDLRMASEGIRTDTTPGDAVPHALPLFHQPHPRWIAPADQRPASVAGRYLQMVEGAGPALQGVVRVLGQPEALPAAIVCTAGRDRTGIVAGLLLAAVGVTEDDIAHDYAVSDLAASSGAGSAVAETMVTFLDLIEIKHGGADAFLTRSGADAASLRQFRASLLR